MVFLAHDLEVNDGVCCTGHYPSRVILSGTFPLLYLGYAPLSGRTVYQGCHLVYTMQCRQYSTHNTKSMSSSPCVQAFCMWVNHFLKVVPFIVNMVLPCIFCTRKGGCLFQLPHVVSPQQDCQVSSFQIFHTDYDY